MILTGVYGLQTSPIRISEEGSETEASSSIAHFPSSLHPVLTPGAEFCCVQEPSHTLKVVPPPGTAPMAALEKKSAEWPGAKW